MINNNLSPNLNQVLEKLKEFNDVLASNGLQCVQMTLDYKTVRGKDILREIRKTKRNVDDASTSR